MSQTHVQQVAENELRQRGPQYADNPMIVQFFEQQVGQELVQQKVLLQEAHKLGVFATDNDVRQYLRTGPTGQVLYPDGVFIGPDAYRQLIDDRLHESVDDFERQIKDEITVRRLQALITAGVTVSDQEVRDAYLKQNIKIKFDYAVISADDLRKTINPSDADLEAFFKKNAAQYAQAVPEERKITYFAFTQEQVPGGVPQPTQQQIQQYYNEHLSDYQVPEQAKSRHILISVPEGADAKTDAAAKAKAESVLKQLQAGGSWTELAKKYSDDPGSKDQGGELGFAQRGKMVPEFDKAIFTQKIGDIDDREEQLWLSHCAGGRAPERAHAAAERSAGRHCGCAARAKSGRRRRRTLRRQLTAEASKNGLEKTAAAHHLDLVTTAAGGTRRRDSRVARQLAAA